MVTNFEPFGSGARGYVNYRIFKEVQKGGGSGRGPSSNSGCLCSVIMTLTVVVLLAAFIIH